MTNFHNNNYPLQTVNCKLLVLSLSGIGNYLMHTPFIAQIRQQRPGWHITLWCALRGQAELARANADIDEVIEHSLSSPFFHDVPFILQLRQRRIDAAVMLSPGQRLKGAAYLAAAGIPERLGHAYPLLGNTTAAAFLTSSIPEVPRTHDIVQNLALLSLLGLTNPMLSTNYSLQTTPYKLAVPPENRQNAAKLLLALGTPTNKPFIGLHPGSAPRAGYKCWPLERFAELARLLIEKHAAHVLILGGAEEDALKQQLKKLLTSHHSLPTTLYSLISADLITTAAVMQCCRLFIGNDSGLMHLASAAGVPTLGLFGPTDERQTGPRGTRSQTIRAPGTQPVYDTEQNWQLGDKSHSSLEQLSVKQVIIAAEKMLR